MPLVHCNFFSHALGMASSMDVILPLPEQGAIGAKYPVMYLLHGHSDDHTIWQRRTSIERYVEGTNLAVVMPNVHRSFYTDMAWGHNYWTYVSEELPRVVQSLFHISSAREDTYVAGLSMGGYGAFKLALSLPRKYSYACSLSGAVDMADGIDLNGKDDAWRHFMQSIYGDLSKFRNSPNDTMHLARKLAKSKAPRPKMYQWCGTEDFLYEDNVRFMKQARELGLDLIYAESPGDHSWPYWDREIQTFLGMLPIKKLA